ncbi:MAG: PLDc N-terminal domain-containing protein [Saprospiraceae bacterium]
MEPIIFGTFLFFAIVLWLWAVIDAVKKSFKQPGKNGGWLLIITLFPVIGPLLYFQIGRKQWN